MVQSLCLTADGKFGLSAADGERHIAIWNIDEPMKKNNKALCTLSLDSPVKHVDTLKLSGKAGQRMFLVAAVSETGIAYVWQCKVKKSQKIVATTWARVALHRKDKVFG